jgi:hypothetical protein
MQTGAAFGSFEQVLARPLAQRRLVCPPASEGVTKLLGAWLAQRNVHWPISVAAGCTGLVPWHITSPDHIGICVRARALEREGIVMHPLPLPKLLVGAAWRGEATPLLRQMLDLVVQVARDLEAVSAAATVQPTRQTRRVTIAKTSAAVMAATGPSKSAVLTTACAVRP